jgi:hypothetical protein
LTWLAEARQRDAWQHTAQVLCLAANCHRNPKERSSPFEPWEFNPFEVRGRQPHQQQISWRAFERLLGLPDEEEDGAPARC